MLGLLYFPTGLVVSLCLLCFYKADSLSRFHSICCCFIFYRTLFLCSNAKEMPASVSDALKEVLQQEGGLSAEEAQQMFAVMESTGRLQSETWS